MDYTDFTNGKTRYETTYGDGYKKEDIVKYNKIRANAQKIIDILTTD